MTKEEILKFYNIQMFNETVLGMSVPCFNGGGEMDTFFGVAWNESRPVNDLLDMIQDYKNGIMLEGGNDLGGADNLAILEGDMVEFMDINTGEIMQEVPLDHLILIAEIWRDYLKKKGW